MVDYTDAGTIRDIIFSDPEVAKRLSHGIPDIAACRREPLADSKFFWRMLAFAPLARHCEPPAH